MLIPEAHPKDCDSGKGRVQVGLKVRYKKPHPDEMGFLIVLTS